MVVALSRSGGTHQWWRHFPVVEALSSVGSTLQWWWHPPVVVALSSGGGECQRPHTHKKKATVGIGVEVYAGLLVATAFE